VSQVLGEPGQTSTHIEICKNISTQPGPNPWWAGLARGFQPILTTLDARMLFDYQCFGDVISLDTTYCTNRHSPPAIFLRINHYRGGVIFGVALLYDDTIESFK